MNQKTYLKIPLDRVGVLIGPKGKVKKRIEDSYGVTLNVESQSGSVEVVLNQGAEDVSVIFSVRNIIKAIGRGFSPRRAEILANEGFDLHILDLTSFVGNSKNALNRVKGRIIGKDGRSRALLEELTETRISVYGYTIGIIGNDEGLRVAGDAIMMLVKGAFHKTVWNFLYAYRRKMKKERSVIWYEGPKPKTKLS